jgi:TATA-binding protein-associated factor
VSFIVFQLRRHAAEFTDAIEYEYCILDEGHTVRSTTSVLYAACARIHAHHRLVLTGTPVQNSVLELFALMNWLMPGYLAPSSTVFNARYTRPIAASRDARTDTLAARAGDDALGRLHRLVLPFTLRRTKQQVLAELPPKSIQDVMCDMSSVQQRLYSAFAERTTKAIGGNQTKLSPLAVRYIFCKVRIAHVLTGAQLHPQTV